MIIFILKNILIVFKKNLDVDLSELFFRIYIGIGNILESKSLNIYTITLRKNTYFSGR